MQAKKKNLYVFRLTENERRKALAEGGGYCCAVHHGQNPPWVSFNKYPEAMDRLIKSSWFVCETCARQYGLSQHMARIVFVDRKTRLPIKPFSQPHSGIFSRFRC